VLCDRVTRRTADGKGGRKSQHYSKHGAGRTRSATAYSMQKCSPGGRSLHASASRASPSTCTNRERTGRVAGPRMTAPEVTSNWLPWQWHVTVVPSNLPIASEQPAWVQVSSKAYRWPSAFATATLVPATVNTRICPAVTSFELPIRTSMALPPLSSCARKRGSPLDAPGCRAPLLSLEMGQAHVPSVSFHEECNDDDGHQIDQLDHGEYDVPDHDSMD